MTRLFLGAVLRLWHRVSKGGIDKWRRGEARSIAAASAPLHAGELSEEDLELVNAHHDLLVEWRQATDEHPLVESVRRRHVYRDPSPRQLAAMRAKALAPVRQFEADPLAAPIPGRHRVAEPVLFGAAVETHFAPKVYGTPLPALPVEPAPWHLAEFTEEWNRADIARMVAKVEAAR